MFEGDRDYRTRSHEGRHEHVSGRRGRTTKARREFLDWAYDAPLSKSGDKCHSISPITPVPSRYESPLLQEGRGVHNNHVKQEDSSRSLSTVRKGASDRHTQLLFSSFALKKESLERRERREREVDMELMAEIRDTSGRKLHFVHVSAEGKPYGPCISVWNDTLGKVVRGLDPSYIDIRQQPYHLMETLMKRMTEDFEYTENINPGWLRTRVGNALSSYWHKIMKVIDAGEERPIWAKNEVWEKLVRFHRSEEYKQKSLQMQYANSCRKRKGRTGPIGVVGIVERLREKLRRTPDDVEVETEMLQDEGYSSKVKRRLSHVSVNEGSRSQMGSSDCNRGTTDISEGLTVPDQMECNPLEMCKAEGDIMNEAAGGNETPGQGPVEPEMLSMDQSQDKSTLPLVQGNPRSSYDAHPLTAIILKQVEEIQKSPFGNNAKGQMIVKSLMVQLMMLNSKGKEKESHIPQDMACGDCPSLSFVEPREGAGEEGMDRRLPGDDEDQTEVCAM